MKPTMPTNILKRIKNAVKILFASRYILYIEDKSEKVTTLDWNIYAEDVINASFEVIIPIAEEVRDLMLQDKRNQQEVQKILNNKI